MKRREKEGGRESLELFLQFSPLNSFLPFTFIFAKPDGACVCVGWGVLSVLERHGWNKQAGKQTLTKTFHLKVDKQNEHVSAWTIVIKQLNLKK